VQWRLAGRYVLLLTGDGWELLDQSEGAADNVLVGPDLPWATFVHPAHIAEIVTAKLAALAA
jgi:hypothetical protein